MPFQVFLTDDAVADLNDLYDFIEQHDGASRAAHVLEQREKAINSLVENPQRGTFPKELLAIGLREYREVFFKPYRIIFRIIDERVFVFVIADGRRDMQSLLQRRLLRA